MKLKFISTTAPSIIIIVITIFVVIIIIASRTHAHTHTHARTRSRIQVDKAAIDRALARACNVLCNMTSALVVERIKKMTDNNIRELHWQITNELEALLEYLECFEKEVPISFFLCWGV